VAASIFDLNSERTVEPGPLSEDVELVRALRAGAEEAYETLLSRFQQPVYNLAMRLTEDASDCADIVQEVFLKVFRNVDSFRGQSSLKTWIYRITVNEAHNQSRWFRRHRRREVGLEEEPNEAPKLADVLTYDGRSPFDYTFDQEKHELIEAALGRINPAFREAVVLRDMAGLSYEEIAEVLQLSLGTVKSRILRGREALRRELEGRLDSQPAMRLVPS
jgi:RNA polymerase sigma-70 factor (ECF subfamily)